MTKLGKKTDTSLKQVTGYNASMAKPLMDKIFFADKVGDAALFIDYGCADGALIEFLAKIFPDCMFIGYDESPDMMVAAAKRFNVKPLKSFDDVREGWSSGSTKKLLFTTSWKDVQMAVEKTNASPEKSCLILSSVIHEMYAYKRDQIQSLWADIWGLNCDFIAIRDMMVSDAASRPSDPLIVARIRQRYEAEPLRAFEAIWGSLDNNWSLTHFLLKYRYVNEWERELRENYLPISVEHLLGMIPTEYAPIFIEHYTLPFLRQKVWEDFGIQLQERTHFKLILQREKGTL